MCWAGCNLVLLGHLQPALRDTCWPCLPTGEYPWAEALSSASRHYARRYRQLCAKRDRGKEEEAILPVEALRLLNGLEERELRIAERVAALQASTGSGVGSNAGAGSNTSAGAGPGVGINAGGSGDASSNTGGTAGSSTGEFAGLVVAGEVALLQAEQQRLHLILCDARNRLGKYVADFFA